MRAVTVIQVPMEKHVVKCDTAGCEFTESQVTSIGGYTQRRGFNTCHVCDKDCCRSHSTYFQDNPSSDYNDAVTCHACAARYASAWMWAEENARRHDCLRELADKRLLEVSADEPGAK